MSLQTRIKAAGAAAAAAPVDVWRRRAVKRRTKRAVMDRMGYDEVARISAYIEPGTCPLGIASCGGGGAQC